MAAAAVLMLWSAAGLAQPTDLAARDAELQPGAAPAEAQGGSAQAEAPETKVNGRQASGAEEPRDLERPARLERGPLVAIAENAELKADETAQIVVVIGGSAKVHGKVREGVVVIGGNLEVDGEVGDAVVVVLGNVKVNAGADLRRDVVAVMGAINVGPQARIHGDALAIAGKLAVARAASVTGQRHEIAMHLEWLKDWLLQCVFKLRPLAPQVGWVWVVAGAFFLFYLLVATAFPRPIQACIEVLDERPATTVVLGILGKVLAPILCLILVATGIGLLVLPFVVLAMFIGVIVGKVALLEWVGLRIGQRTPAAAFQQPLGAFVLGASVLTLLYMIWVVGLLAYLWFGIWGLGVAITAALEGLRRRRLQAAATVAPVVPPGPAMTAPGPAGVRETVQGGAAQPAPAPEPPIRPQPPKPALGPEASAWPRAGFWERMAAAFLDVVLLGVVGALLSMRMPWILLMALAYFAGMWAWKGTTIGGTVLGLKIVRLDGQPLDLMVALVRALGAGFSIIVLFLGLLWIAWDREKQGWHDRIAGTVVVRLPNPPSLVCY